MNRYYRHTNGDVIAATARFHGFTGDTFWWKINRAERTVIDSYTGTKYPIPPDVDLT